MAEKLVARDIEQQDFPRKVRGYDPENVRLYLRSVGEEVGRLNLDNEELRGTTSQLQKQLEEYKAREKSLQDALVAAQRLSEEITTTARSEAEMLVKEARNKAERLLGQAQDQLLQLEGEIGRCKLERDAFEQRLRGAIEEHLNLLEMRKTGRTEPEKPHPLRSVSGLEVG